MTLSALAAKSNHGDNISIIVSLALLTRALRGASTWSLHLAPHESLVGKYGQLSRSHL